MEKKEFWMKLREEDLTEETKTLISLLPSERQYLGRNLCKYQGSWYYDNFLQGVLNVQRGFQPQDTDVIVASFPKCGTLWLKALTVALFERSKNRSSEDLMSHHHPLLSNHPHNLVPVLEMNLYRDTSKPDLTMLLASSPRLFSTHMPFNTLQEALKDSPCKVVYICRDAKDSLVSRWHLICRCLNKEEDRSILESMFEYFCSGVCLFGPLWDHILSYWKARLENPKHVLFLKYDEMKADAGGQLKKLAEFLGCPFSEEEENNGAVAEILKMCSLSNLSSLEVNKTGESINGIDYKNHFRKGIVGDWKNYLTLEMGNKIDMIMEEKLKDSGLKF